MEKLEAEMEREQLNVDKERLHIEKEQLNFKVDVCTKLTFTKGRHSRGCR